MTVDEVNTATPSAYANEISKEILENYKIPAVTGKFFFELHTSLHKQMIEKLDMDFQEYFNRAIYEAVRNHYAVCGAKLRLTDIANEREILDNSEGMTDEEVIKKRIVQLVTVRAMSQHNQMSVLHEMIKEKLEISATVSEKLYPVIPLNAINAKMIGSPIHFDCLVIGTAAPKLIIINVRTLNSGGTWIDYKDYNEKVHGEIIDQSMEDVQDILVEEIFLKTKPGKTTRKITLKMYHNNVGRFNGGDKLRVLGLYSTHHEDADKHEKRTVIHSLNVKKFNEESQVSLTHQELQTFRDRATTDPEGYLDGLTDSFVPNVLGNKNQKILILLSAVKSTQMFKDRSNIHCIFDDIPGTGKSDLLKNAVDFIQGSIYVDAPNATSRGLLYGQEDFEKTKILREGVMLRYSMVFLDEFDKLDHKERQAVNTAVQQQVATYTKVPFITSKAIDCTIIAAANPKNEKWLTSRKTMENLAPLEPSIISRFIISKMEHLDDVDDFVDYKINFKESKIKNQASHSPDQIKGLINHCKNLNPSFSPAGNIILKKYLKSFQTIQESSDFDLPVDKRKEVDVMRLCSALAKLLMKSTVDEWTVTYAVTLYKYTLSTIGMNTDAPTAQTLMSEHTPISQTFEMIFNLLRDGEGHVNETELKSEMEKSEKWQSPHEISKYIQRVHDETRIYEPRPGYYKSVQD